MYNHEPYLRDCLEGFVMQKTNFPFKAVVHDDCSTDSSAAIIREYAEKYPDIIEPIYETENLYSKRDGSLGRVMDAACNGRSKYFALCEGDDYWIDPYKLQKQVDYMDNHSECSMVCTKGDILTPSGFLPENETDQYKSDKSKDFFVLDVNDIIIKGGAYIYTCSIMYRAGLREDFPEFLRKCLVGDYPLQVFAALKGEVCCINRKMVVYRCGQVGSWTHQNNLQYNKKSVKLWISVIRMLESLNKYSNFKYDFSFRKAIVSHLRHWLDSAPHLLTLLSKEIGYVFVNNYIGNSQKQVDKSLKNMIIQFLSRIKWYPFEPSPLVQVYKKLTLLERLKVGFVCKSVKKPSTYCRD